MPQSTKNPASRISRRAVLRGAGCTMALPWLGVAGRFRRYAAGVRFPETFRRCFPGVRH